MDSLVFLGPEEKPFKLRIYYDAQEGHLQILGIHSRIFGQGKIHSYRTRFDFCQRTAQTFQIRMIDCEFNPADFLQGFLYLADKACVNSSPFPLCEPLQHKMEYNLPV